MTKFANPRFSVAQGCTQQARDSHERIFGKPSSMVLYQHAEDRLEQLRIENEGKTSPEEDALLERMDDIWSRLTDTERKSLSREE